MSSPTPLPPDRREVRRALLASAPLGIVVALAAVGYLGLVHGAENLLFTTVPDGLGWESTPGWYVVVVLAVGGALTGLAVGRLRGHGGHHPLDGFGGGATLPSALPGVLLAALASLGFGAVLGPEAPLLALGSALGLMAARAVGISGRMPAVVAAAGAFGALSALLGGPLIAAVLVLELAVIRRLPLPATLPGLLAASVGYVVFAGTDRWAGVAPPSFDLGLTPATEIGFADVAAGLLAGVAVIVVLAAVQVAARVIRAQAGRGPAALTTAVAGIGVALTAVAFATATGESVTLVLFSGQAATGPVIASGADWGLGVLLALVVAKAVAYALSLGGGFRGGAIFPAIMLGATCATTIADLPWSADASLAAALAIAAAVAAVTRMPFTATVLATMLVGATAEVSVVAGLGALLGTLLSRATPPDQRDESDAPPTVRVADR